MDFLFASLFIWAQEQGFEGFNLGLSPLSGVGEKPRDPALERLLHFVYNYANQFYNFKGLHSYKEKFKPTWEPRYLIFPNSATLPAVLSTLLRAHSSENLFWNRTKIN